MRVGRFLFVAAVVLASLPTVGAKDLQPVTVVDLFQDMDLGDMTFLSGCGRQGNTASQFILDPANQTFQFLEGPLGPGIQSRSSFVGCGTATFQALLPPSTDHIHVRFTADRVVNAQITELSSNFTQEVRVSFDGGEPIILPYFANGAGTQPPTSFDPPAYAVPAGAQRVSVQWLFEDLGSTGGLRSTVDEINDATGADLRNPVSSHTLNATVHFPQIEFSGAPVPGLVSYKHVVVEDTQSQQTRVKVTADDLLLSTYEVNLRVEVDETLHLVEVITPNGTRLRQFTSNPLAGTIGFRPYSPDGEVPLVEPRIDFYRATLPGEVVAQHGAGTYTFVFSRDVPLDAPGGLVALALVVLALPFVAGARALYGVGAFRREAFGLYKKSASGLLLGVLLTLAYYLAFVVQILQQGQHVVMAHWPLASRGVLLYLNVLLAFAALAAFGLVGRRLHDITRPARDA